MPIITTISTIPNLVDIHHHHHHIRHHPSLILLETLGSFLKPLGTLIAASWEPLRAPRNLFEHLLAAPGRLSELQRALDNPVASLGPT